MVTGERSNPVAFVGAFILYEFLPTALGRLRLHINLNTIRDFIVDFSEKTVYPVQCMKVIVITTNSKIQNEITQCYITQCQDCQGSQPRTVENTVN